jgi:uncharacterized protein
MFMPISKAVLIASFVVVAVSAAKPSLALDVDQKSSMQPSASAEESQESSSLSGSPASDVGNTPAPSTNSPPGSTASPQSAPAAPASPSVAQSQPQATPPSKESVRPSLNNDSDSKAALPLPRTRALLPVPSRFSSVSQALRIGVERYREGDKEAASLALKYAADNGSASARFKLGQMYASGDGVPQDDQQAFDFFRKITLESADEAPDSQAARVVSRAFIAVGNYYRDGIPNSDVVPDMQEAYRNYHYAAAYFGDPDAQYNLARLYLDGALGDKDPKQAARWLKLAADKKHRYAQALLGHMLFYGTGIIRQPASGLAWLKLADQSASAEKDQWIKDSYRQADEAANDELRQIADKLIEQYRLR